MLNLIILMKVLLLLIITDVVLTERDNQYLQENILFGKTHDLQNT